MKLTSRHTKYASYLGYITQAIVNNLSPLLFVTFHTHYGVSLEQLGLLVSYNFGIQILVDLLSARYIDRIGYRVGAVAAHLIAAFGLVLMAILPQVMDNTFLAILIATFFTAVGGGMDEVLISPIVESLPGDEKASAMSILHSFYCWGHMAVVILSTLYFTLFGIENWYWLPMIWALIPLFDAFLFSKVPLYALVEESERVPVGSLIRSGAFWVFLLIMVASGASEQAMSQWSSLFAEEGLRVSKAMGDLLGPCMFACLMGISRLIYGIFGERLDVKKGLVLSGFMCIGSYLLAVLSHEPILSLAGCALCGFSVGLMWPGTFSLAARSFTAGGTAAFALLALAGDIGCSSGPGLVGWISGASGAETSVTGALKRGIGSGIIFPVLLLAGLFLLTRLTQRKNG